MRVCSVEMTIDDEQECASRTLKRTCTIARGVGLIWMLAMALMAQGEDTVSLRRDRLEELLQPPPERPHPLPEFQVAHRTVTITQREERLEIQVEWDVSVREPGWLHLPLAGETVVVESVRFHGREVVTRAEGDKTWLHHRADRSGRVVLRGTLASDAMSQPVSLGLLPALYGKVYLLPKAGLVGRLAGASAGIRVRTHWLTGAQELRVQFERPRRKAVDRRTLALGNVGIGLTIDDGVVLGRARVGWELRQGQLDEVSFSARNVGDDLQVSGPNIESFTRSGDRVRVQLINPTSSRVDLSLAWSQAVPDADLSVVDVPGISPDGCFKYEGTIQIGQAGSLETIPEMPGWQAIASSQLPEFGRDLVSGRTAASYRTPTADRKGKISLLRYVPAPGPPVMVDVASENTAVSRAGRALTRALYTVRNERAAHLRVQPPPGASILSVRVAEVPVTTVRDGDAQLVPLPRSLETMDGLLSFPVEVVYLSEFDSWVREEERSLPFASVNAPIAVHRATVHLPPTFENEVELGRLGRVESFTEGEGLAYGFGLGDGNEAKADQLWQDAQSAYMSNDFDEADALLDELESLGATNENIGKLRSNVDIFQGRGKEKAQSMAARRVKERAKSRGIDDYRAQEEAQRQAEEAMASGDYERAERSYQQVQEYAARLDKLEQAENVEQKALRSKSTAKMKDVEANLAQEEEGRRMMGVEGEAAGRSGGGASLGGLTVVDDGGPLFSLDTDEPDLASRAADDLKRDEAAEKVAQEAAMGMIAAGEDDFVEDLAEEEPAPAVELVEPPAIAAEELQRSTLTLESVAVSGRGFGGRSRSRKPSGKRSRRAMKADEVAPRVPPPEPGNSEFETAPLDSADVDDDPAMTGYALEALEVTSTSTSVVIPAHGQTIRYQSLLIPANTAPSVTLRARSTDRTLPRRKP